MGCIRVFIKAILIIINFIVTILGLLLVAGGSVLIYFRETILTNNGSANDQLFLLAIITIVVGCIVFLIGFCGCCGSIADVSCLLITYGIFIILLAALNIYIIVILFGNQSSTSNSISDILDGLFKDSDTRETFYFLEYYYNCCGTTGSDSYLEIQVAIPPTCCKDFEIPDIQDITDIEEIINNLNGTNSDFCLPTDTYEGCTTIVVDFLLSIISIVAYVFIGLLVVEVLAIISAFYLVYQIRRKRAKAMQRTQPVYVYPGDPRQYRY